MRPLIAIVGRPNVGKSTLYNRLVGQQLSIVHDMPGVTRDRHYADAYLHGREVTVIDTGGFDPGSDDPMGQGIARHVLAAIDEADVVLCIFDGTTMPTSADEHAVRLLRRSGKPVVYAANKVDTQKQQLDAMGLYSLGVSPILPISAAHGRGLGELERALIAGLPEAEPESGRRNRDAQQSSRQGADDAFDVEDMARAADEIEPADAANIADTEDAGESQRAPMIPKVALIGRPNAGKSSLFNRLAGMERSLVDDRPGTTRDPVDMTIELDDRQFLVVDTAGVRRRSKVDRGVEAVSVMRSLRAVERADVVVLMCDATEGIAEQDARLLGLCADRGRAIVVALNKMDLLDDRGQAKARRDSVDALHFARWATVVELSAKTGRGVNKLMRTVWAAAEQFHRRIPTGELNRFFANVLEQRPPPTSGNRAPRIYYVTQARTSPPQFVAKCNHADSIQESYRRFVANQLREAFGFAHVPVVVHYRERKRR